MATTLEEARYETEVFASLNEVEMTEVTNEAWQSETRLAMLAWEIARYDPAIAKRLVEAGKRKLAA